MSITVNSDFSALLHAFVDRNVEFLLIGAHALAVHGVPRFSEDIDLWTHPTAENAARVYQASGIHQKGPVSVIGTNVHLEV